MLRVLDLLQWLNIPALLIAGVLDGWQPLREILKLLGGVLLLLKRALSLQRLELRLKPGLPGSV